MKISKNIRMYPEDIKVLVLEKLIKDGILLADVQNVQYNFYPEDMDPEVYLLITVGEIDDNKTK